MYDTTSQLNNTQNSSQTANPQAGNSNPGASNGADFQSTAPVDALNTETDELTVQETGDAIVGGTKSVESNSLPTGWLIVIVLGLIIAVVVAIKIIRELIAEEQPKKTTKTTVAKAVPVKSNKTTAKKASKSVSRKGKKKTTKKSKKPTSKRK